MAKTAKYLKYGGYVGIGLGGTASWLTVRDACRVGETESCKKIRYTEIGSLTGGLLGGIYGARVGSLAAFLTCGTVAAMTAGVGGPICGIVLVGGGSLAGAARVGMGGEWVGDVIFGLTRP
ncbi:hypothetical protein D3C77_574710 [compost metagenome]